VGVYLNAVSANVADEIPVIIQKLTGQLRRRGYDGKGGDGADDGGLAARKQKPSPERGK
jgi:hypothetical protein